MIIRVLSFDMDGCIFNEGFLLDREDKHKSVITYNKAFLDSIKEENVVANYSKVITFVGSNRQSARTDKFNMVRLNTWVGLITSGSCFPAIQNINTYLEAILDKFLLADIHGDLESGTSFDLAMKGLTELYTPKSDGSFHWDQEQLQQAVRAGLYQGEKHADYYFDEHKATLIYAQIHKIANENPTAEIQFDFYDDRDDILGALHAFYETHNTLLPNNVTLHLHKYNGGDVLHKHTAQGTGIIDTAYKETIREMWELTVKATGRPFSIEQDQIRTNEFITPNLLTKRRPLTIDVSANAQNPTTASQMSFFAPPKINTKQYPRPLQSDLDHLKLKWDIDIAFNNWIIVRSLDDDYELLEDMQKVLLDLDIFTVLHGRPEAQLIIKINSLEQLQEALIELGLAIEAQEPSSVLLS